jgi:Fe2+ or Zn2+ uptake regulation protein
VSVTHPLRGPTFAWPDGEAYTDHPRGTLKSGKEAEIFLVERRFARSGPRLLAHKRYRIRYPGKDELRDEGFSNATSFRRHAMYREGWNVGARDRRALAAGNKSRHGQELASVLWPIQEWATLRRAWEAGVSVPCPIERTEDGLLMEYIGDESQAAPKLVQARLETDALAVAWAQLADNLRALTAAGLLRRIEPAGSPARYETRVGDNHHHVVCRSCGAAKDIDCVIGAAPCLTPDDAGDFVIDEAEVTFWGLCPECQATQQVA